MIINNRSIERVIFLLVILGILLGMFYFMKKVNFSRKLFHDVTLGTNVLISSEWTEIEVTNLVNVEKDRNFIGIVVDPPLKVPIQEQGILIPSGEIVNPEIKLIDEDGREYPLIPSGARGEKISNYEFEGKLPSDKTYKRVLLRSDFPIKAKEILWSGYNAKDLK